MYSAIPGKTGIVVVRPDFSSTAVSAKKPAKSILHLVALLEKNRKEVAKPAPKSEPKPAPMPAVKPEVHGTLQMACPKGGPMFQIFRREDFDWNPRRGIEQRDRTHSHFGRRGRRAVEIFR